MSLDLDSGATPVTGRGAARAPVGAHRLPGWVVPGAPALLALALGLWGLPRQGALWRDEAATWEAAQRSVPEIWHMIGQVDVVHCLYYLLIHTVFEVFGPGLAALRLPSVLGAVIAAAATAATGRRLTGPMGGLSAGLVLALLPVMQRYAQEGRAFALVSAGVVVATWLLVGAVCPERSGTSPDGRERRGEWAWAWRWGAYTAVMLTTALLNWLSLLALAAHGVTVLIAWRAGQRPLLARWLAAAAVIVSGTLPLILASRRQVDQVAWIPPASGVTLLGVTAMLVVALICARVPRHRISHSRIPPHRIPQQGIPSQHPRSERTELSHVAVGLPLLAVPQSVLLLASWLVKPLYVDRYVLFAYTGLALLVGPAVARAVRAAVSYGRTGGRSWRRIPGEALLAGVVAVVFAALLPLELSLRTPASRTDDVRVTADRVAALARPGDGIVFVPDQRRDAALVTPSSFRGLHDLALAESPVASGTLYGVEAAPPRIRAAMLARKRIVVVTDIGSTPAPATPRDRAKLATLAQHFTLTSSAEAGGRRVLVYVRTR
ncbi:hypothetical protein FCH28_02350 [Streptomyces piniterrae]|uniref:Glycosyltransferase RgtA/B/C/D-like domain-containing protein n=1 Tax=Streptomyces piniterrae TaxID=2571125 RepID=A0A4U0NW71_9ACTN|nr:glycosyltransferase family 39 protein [Streptomyces piniterrae]TJZ59007.1 hypothetical protein FCH28_02350 [Streptomyces piniterrae]